MLDRAQRGRADAQAHGALSRSESSVTWTRFGKKRVRVLRFEWLTLLPY